MRPAQGKKYLSHNYFKNYMDFLDLLFGVCVISFLFPIPTAGKHWKVLMAVTALLMWIPISFFSLLVVMDQAEAYTFESTTGVMEESYYEKVRPYATTYVYGEPVTCVYELHIAYSYSTPGSEFHHSGTAFALWDQNLRREVQDSHWTCQNTSPPGIIADFVEDNPEGATVTVYYDPSDPQRSVVHRGFEGGTTFIVTMVNIIFLLLLVYKLSRSDYPRMRYAKNALNSRIRSAKEVLDKEERVEEDHIKPIEEIMREI